MKSTSAVERARREGIKRLHPSLTDPNWLVLRKRREIFTRWLRQINQLDPVTLDVGGRIQPYRPLITQKTSPYIAVDIVPTALVSVIGDAALLPVRSDCFDLVLCTQMLEYAFRPQQVIDEIHRVLKPGGHLLLSAPAVYPQDYANEYWRFLPCALREMMAQFSAVEVVAEGSSLTGFIRTTNVCVVSFTTIKVVRKFLSVSLVPLLNLFGLLLERLRTTHDTSFSANFSVLAKK